MGDSADRVAAEVWPRDETLQDWLERACAAAPAKIAIKAPDMALDYAGLQVRVRALGAAFRELGLGHGDVVAAQLPNGVEFVLTFLAAGSIGAVLQTIHMPYRAAELEPLLRHGGAKAFVCLAGSRDFSAAALAVTLRQRLPALRHVIAVGEAPEGALTFPPVASAAPADLPRPRASDRFLLLYTSGTVAAPKGVPITYREFLANARLSAVDLGIDQSAILLSAAPFTHLYGLFSVLLALASSATLALLPAFTPPAFAAALDALRPTGVLAGPAHLNACLGAGLLTPERLASLRFMLISGSACPPDLARTAQERMANGKVLQLWGMSELQAGSFTRPGDDLESRVGSVGRAGPGIELRIANEGRLLPVGEEGELQARGWSVFAGYLDNAAATAAAFTADGWFRTGDLARLDAAGNLRLTGRIKELINRGGVKFNPTDVEAIIDRHPAVAQCAIVPMPDPVLGEKACCFLVLRDGAMIDLDGLRDWLGRHGVAKLKWPERLEPIAELPMTPTRKVKKAELAARLRAP